MKNPVALFLAMTTVTLAVVCVTQTRRFAGQQTQLASLQGELDEKARQVEALQVAQKRHDQQAEQLLVFMKVEKQNVPAATGQSLAGADQDQAKIETLLSGEQSDKLLQPQETVNQRVFTQSAGGALPSTTTPARWPMMIRRPRTSFASRSANGRISLPPTKSSGASS